MIQDKCLCFQSWIFSDTGYPAMSAGLSPAQALSPVICSTTRSPRSRCLIRTRNSGRWSLHKTVWYSLLLFAVIYYRCLDGSLIWPIMHCFPNYSVLTTWSEASQNKPAREPQTVTSWHEAAVDHKQCTLSSLDHSGTRRDRIICPFSRRHI